MTASCLHIDMRVGETMSLDGGRIRVELEDKSGRIARLKVLAPKDVEVKICSEDESVPAMRAITET